MFNKKLTVALLLGLIISFATPSFAGIGIKLDGVSKTEAKTINLIGPAEITKTNGAVNIPVVDSTLIAAGAANGGATSMLSATTAVPVTFTHVNMQITTSDPAFSAKTLADGKKGQILIIHVYNGSQTTTVTPVTSTAWSVATFNAVDDNLVLLYFNDTVGWLVQDSTSVTITP